MRIEETSFQVSGPIVHYACNAEGTIDWWWIAESTIPEKLKSREIRILDEKSDEHRPVTEVSAAGKRLGLDAETEQRMKDFIAKTEAAIEFLEPGAPIPYDIGIEGMAFEDAEAIPLPF